MKVLLLVNPFSSSVTARTRVVIRKALAGDHDVELVETARRGHATRLAQGASADGVDVVVCLGDGARRSLGSHNLPVEAAILGIVDSVELGEHLGPRPLTWIAGSPPVGVAPQGSR